MIKSDFIKNLDLGDLDEQDLLDICIQIFEEAPRLGAEKDQPEGARYIQVSDTLATKIVDWMGGGA